MRILSAILLLVSFWVFTNAQAATLAQKTTDSLQKFTNIYNTQVPHNGITGQELVRTERVSSLPDGKHSMLSVDYTATSIQYTLKYTETALHQPELLARDLTILEAMKFRWLSVAIYTTSEILYNAQHGSAMGQYRLNVSDLALIKSSVSRTAIENEFSQGDEELKLKIKEEVANGILELEKNQRLLYEKALLADKSGYKALEKWRKETKILDTLEHKAEKLNDLLLKNDRKGVRQMIEAYLPWTVMDRLETQMWKAWLEAIENPNPKKTIVALRGVDYSTDKVQSLKLPNGQERFAFMSTVLTKNQGNYTRRLRSLTTKREQNGRFSSETPGVMMTQQWKKHASDPVGSSFLSFTLSPEIANSFKGYKSIPSASGGPAIFLYNGGLLAVRIDERRLIPNLVSPHAEAEFLAPLVIFPDEVVAFRDFTDAKKDYTAEFYAEVLQKTGIDFVNKSLDLKKDFIQPGRKFMMEATKVPVAGQCSAVFH